MPGHVKQSGVWGEISQPAAKVGGVWMPASRGTVKVSGVWEEWYSQAPIVTTPSAVKNVRITAISGNSVTIAWDPNDPSENITEYAWYLGNDYPPSAPTLNPSGPANVWGGASKTFCPKFIGTSYEAGGYGGAYGSVGVNTTASVSYGSYIGDPSVQTYATQIRVIAKNAFGWGDQRSNTVYIQTGTRGSYMSPYVPPVLTAFTDPSTVGTTTTLTGTFTAATAAYVESYSLGWWPCGGRYFNNQMGQASFAGTTSGSATSPGFALSANAAGLYGFPFASVLGGYTNYGNSRVALIYSGFRDGFYPDAEANCREILPVWDPTKISQNVITVGTNIWEGGEYPDLGMATQYFEGGNAYGGLSPGTIQAGTHVGKTINAIARSGMQTGFIGMADLSVENLQPIKIIGYGGRNEYARYCNVGSISGSRGSWSLVSGPNAVLEFVDGLTFSLRMLCS